MNQYFPDKNLLAFHIPKCGGTFLCSAIKRYIPGRRKKYANLPHGRRHDIISKVCKNWEIDLTTTTIVTSVRNPYHRFISSYAFQIKKGRINQDECSIEDFASMLPEWAVDHDMSKSQCYYLEDVEPTYLVRLETINDDLNHFLRTFLNSKRNFTFGNVNHRDINKNEIIDQSSYDEILSDDVKEKVY